MNRLGFKSRFALLGSAAVLAVTLGTAANAQVQEQQTPPQENGSATDRDNGEIIITAQKREEAILDIPQSVTVVGGDTLERQHSVTFSDYLAQVPGLSMEQGEPGVSRLVLRGVNTGGVSQTVSVYVDETPVGSSTGLVNGAILAGDFDTFDISRIEVLRGPQGTLYGASSLGGVLKFVTNTPQLGKFGARGRAGLEFVDGGGTGYNFAGVVNAPLGDIAAFRGSGFYRKNAGWIDAVAGQGNFLGVDSIGDKDINEGQVWGGRGSVLFKPTAELTIRLTAIAQHIESDADNGVEVDQQDYDPIGGKLTQTVYNREPNELKYRLFNGIIEYDFGFASLQSSTSFNKSDQTFTTDLTNTFGTFFNFLFGPLNPGPPFPAPVTTSIIGAFQDQQTDLSKFTEEVRLTSPSNDKFEWLVGLYYTKEDGKIDQLIGANDAATGQVFPDPGLGNVAVARLDSNYKEIAGFANVTWHATDRFDITAGGRWSKNDQSATQFSGGNPFLVGAGGTLETKSDESVFTYSISPRFDVSDNTAVYARVAKGYRPGGPNVVPPTAGPDVPRTFGADTLTSWEVGLKSDVGRRMSLDLSAYHLKWKDIQLFTVIDNFGLNINGTSAVSNGIEGSVTFRPVQGLNLSANAAWIDAHLTGDTPILVGGFKGDRLPWVPKTSFSLNSDYEWKISGSATAFVGGTLAYTGSQRDNFVAGGDSQRRIPDYATIDLRAGVDFGKFIVDAYVKNLTNTEGVSSIGEFTDALTGANGLPNDAIRAALTRPRTIGLSLTAGF